MDINKAQFTTDGNTFKVSMPIVKINKENRTVSGFATLDNVDTQDDIVDAAASERAFAKWRGNVREQHSSLAVGKLLSFEPQTYYDADSGNTYNGIYVNTYVSKGAPDTWEKVLDGTLTGFSIGGGILKAVNVFAKAGESKKVRKVMDYTISELSLVDNPANQLANILSFQKSADGEISASGLLTDTKIENIFYCPTDELGVTTSDESISCHKCEQPMENIGWMESGDENETTLVKNAIEKFINEKSFASEKKIDDNKYNITINVNGDLKNPDKVVKGLKKALKTKGGVEVAEEVKTEGAAEDAVESLEKAVDGVEEVAAEGSEVPEPTDFTKVISDLTESLTTTIKEGNENTATAIAGIKDEFAKSVTSIDEKVSALAEKVNGIEEKVNSQNELIDGVEKRVGDVVDATAMKKSGDLGGEPESNLKKSIWDGTFLPVRGLQ